MKQTNATTAVRAHRRVVVGSNWQEWIREPQAATNLPATGAYPEKIQPSHEAIARLAYAIWEERGRPFGSPEADWLRAEQQLLRQHDPK